MNINNTNESIITEKAIKNYIYSGLYKVGNKCPMIVRPLGILIGVGSFALTGIARVAVIIESLVKGIIHLIGCPFSKKCTLKGAGRQFLTLGQSLYRLPFALVSSALGIIKKTWSMNFNHPPSVILSLSHKALEAKQELMDDNKAANS